MNRFPSNYEQSVQQASREEIAQLNQEIHAINKHIQNRQQNLNYLQQTMKTQEDAVVYATLLLEQNKLIDSVKNYTKKLEDMLRISNFNFGNKLSNQTKKEIYHLYHSGKYTQVELANQYNTTQSTISKIIQKDK